MAPLNVLLGFFLSFIFERICENTNKKAGEECSGDCGQCKAHCVGFHCYRVRQRVQNEENSEREDPIN